MEVWWRRNCPLQSCCPFAPRILNCCFFSRKRNNQINKKYYGEPINRVIDKQVTRIDVLKAQLSYVDETLLNVKNSNAAINVDSLEINLTRLAANKPLPLTKLQIQKSISAIDTRVSTSLTEAKKTTALKHLLELLDKQTQLVSRPKIRRGDPRRGDPINKPRWISWDPKAIRMDTFIHPPPI